MIKNCKICSKEYSVKPYRYDQSNTCSKCSGSCANKPMEKQVLYPTQILTEPIPNWTVT